MLNNLWRSYVHFALPPIAERERFTWKTLPMAAVAVLPLLLAAHIRLRRPNLPLLIKIFILITGLPIVSHMFLKRYFVAVYHDSFDGVPYTINHLNFVTGMAVGFAGLKFIEVLLLGKDEEFKVKGAKEYNDRHKPHQGKRDGVKCLERPMLFPGTVMPLEVDMIINIRGQGYNWGLQESKAGYKARIETEELAMKSASVALSEKWSHLHRVGKSFLINYALMDICDSIVKDAKIFPPAGRPGGGSVEEAVDGVFGRLGPLLVVITTGVMIFVALQALYSLLYLLQLVFTRPANIPLTVSKNEPLPFYRPHSATSLASFWSIHWHAFIRRTFTVSVYKPIRRCSNYLGLPSKVGQMAAIIATFALSGLLHEGCLEGQVTHYHDKDLTLRYGHLNLSLASNQKQSRYGFGARNFLTTYAFTVQAFFVILEGFWLSGIEPRIAAFIWSRSGKKGSNDKLIHGAARDGIGWFWTMSCMVYSGYFLTDLWLTHGLGNSICTLRLFSRVYNFVLSPIYR